MNDPLVLDHVRHVLTELCGELRARILTDCYAAGLTPSEANDRATAIITYLGLAVGKWADRGSTLTTWETSGGKPRGAFPRQALSMTWDYTEDNPFGAAGFHRGVEGIAIALEHLPEAHKPGYARQGAAQRIRRAK